MPKNNFRLFPRQVMMLKAWLRGLHHHAKHLQPYLDEFTWRFDNRNNPNLFGILISSMMKLKPTLVNDLNFYWGS